MNYIKRELEMQKAEEKTERATKLQPRHFILRLPNMEVKRLILPGGYDIDEDEGLFKLDKWGYKKRSIIHKPVFVIEYLLIKKPTPMLMAKIVFVRLGVWKGVLVRVPNGFTTAALFKAVDYGMMAHSNNISRLCSFINKFAELNNNNIPIKTIESMPKSICEVLGNYGEGK